MGLELFVNITFQSIIASVVAILGFMIGALIYSRDIRRIDNLSFFLLAWVFCMWALFLGAFESVSHGNLEYLFLIALYIFAAAIPPAVLFFIMVLSPGGRIVFTKIKTLLVTIPFILVSFLVFIPDFIFKAVKEGSGVAKDIIFGYGSYIFILYIFVYILVGIVLLFKKYKNSAGVFRKEIYYIFILISINALFILFINIVLPYLGYYNLFWVGPVIGVLSICIVGYLILKYNYWNLKLAATDLFTSLISLTLIFELITSISVIDFIIKTIILSLVLLSGLFLVKSVRHEIESREEVERLVGELAGVNDNLHILDKQKSEFVVIASKHLRAPLTTINEYTTMILDGSFGEVKDEAKEAVGRISKSSERLVVIIEDFMNISKIESGKMDYKFSNVDIKKMVVDLVDEMSISAKKNGLSLKLDIVENCDFISRVDSGKLRQVISNLIDNAIKYTPAGFVNISLSKNKNKKVLIKIFDTGIGMSQNTLKKIFHKFSRAEGASKLHTDGSGLGLYVAREMLKKHEGRIWAESDGVGKGSIFYVELNT